MFIVIKAVGECRILDNFDWIGYEEYESGTYFVVRNRGKLMYSVEKSKIIEVYKVGG